MVAAGLAAREVFQLLAGAGYPSLAWFGIAFTVGLVLDSAAAPMIDPNGGVLLAVGFVLAAVGAFTRPDPRDGLPTWFATVFGAVYASFLGYILRLGEAAPAIPAGSALVVVHAGAGLDPAPRPLGLGLRHRCVLRRQAVRAAEVPDPHLGRRRPMPG